MSRSANVEVEYHQFSFAENFADTLDIRSDGAVFQYGPGFVTIHTGIASGPARVTVDPLEAAPNEDEVDDWEAVAEVFLTIKTPLRVTTMGGELAEGIDEYDGRPGLVGIRVHARGRDTNWDLIVDDPTEEYLIQVWPAGPSEGVPRLIKKTDAAWDPEDQAEPDHTERAGVDDARVRRFGPVHVKGD